MNDQNSPSRRELFSMIGKAGGALAMYQAMTALGHAAETQFTGPPKLTGAPKGKKVLVLGAGLGGMLAAYELRKAGYIVQVLEFQNRPGGRNYSIRGGDKVVEVGGATQTCDFQPGNYLNPGPWRIPHHHRTLLHYCKAFGVELEPFIQLNHKAFVHSTKAFGGKPQRYKELAVDYKGHVSELLAKSLNSGALDQKVSKEDKEKLVAAMREWGLLDGDLNYTSSLTVSGQRQVDPAWWQLRLEWLRLMRQPDAFDLAALDYCVTYEVSPPAWQEARCNFEGLVGPGASLTGLQGAARFGADSQLTLSDSGAPSTLPQAEDGQIGAAGVLFGVLLGDATATLMPLEPQARRSGLAVISCERLVRVDFAAAGSVLNWAATQQAAGVRVQFRELHRLAAVFLAAGEPR